MPFDASQLGLCMQGKARPSLADTLSTTATTATVCGPKPFSTPRSHMHALRCARTTQGVENQAKQVNWNYWICCRANNTLTDQSKATPPADVQTCAARRARITPTATEQKLQLGRMLWPSTLNGRAAASHQSSPHRCRASRAARKQRGKYHPASGKTASSKTRVRCCASLAAPHTHTHTPARVPCLRPQGRVRPPHAAPSHPLMLACCSGKGASPDGRDAPCRATKASLSELCRRPPTPRPPPAPAQQRTRQPAALPLPHTSLGRASQLRQAAKAAALAPHGRHRRTHCRVPGHAASPPWRSPAGSALALSPCWPQTSPACPSAQLGCLLPARPPVCCARKQPIGSGPAPAATSCCDIIIDAVDARRHVGSHHSRDARAGGPLPPGLASARLAPPGPARQAEVGLRLGRAGLGRGSDGVRVCVALDRPKAQQRVVEGVERAHVVLLVTRRGRG